MIGNWVFVGSGTDWEEKLQVDEIFEHSVGFKGREFTTYLTSLEPIQITEEILLKNGFYKKVLFEKNDFFGEVAEYEKSFCNFFVAFRKTNDDIDRIWYVHIGNSNLFTCCSCDVQYIHQVQNLANILGFSIEFEL